jgi:hypothetical protein
MLPAGSLEPAIVEASCEGPPAECEKPDQALETAYRRLVESSPPGVRGRLIAAQEAWLAYLAAQTAAVLVWQRPSEPALQTRLRDSVRGRLSLDRMAHLATLEARREGMKAHSERLQAEAASLARLDAGCGAGIARSCTSLGDALDSGWYSIDRDRPRARALYQKACDLGSGAACAALAHALRAGRGIAKDPTRATRLLQTGCDAGDPANCQSLARAHAGGDGVTKDPAKAVALWEHACDLSRSDGRSYWSEGHPCQGLARALESGDPIPRDPGRALALHEEACEREQPDGCVAAARLVRRQGGFDPNRVVSLYRRGCAEYRMAEACAELGDLYRDGNGVPADKGAALNEYQLACRSGYVPGCRAASELTGTPLGDPDDRIRDPGYIKTVRFVPAESVPPLRLRLFGDDHGTVDRLQVFDEAGSRVTQEITVPETPGGESGATLPLEQVDLDFDGYKDLTLRSYTGANNAGDFVWILDPVRRRFEFCPELSDLPNLAADPERGVITSTYHFSASEGSIGQYKWVGGKAVLVREDSTRLVRAEGGDCLEQLTRQLVGGRMVETGRACE